MTAYVPIDLHRHRSVVMRMDGDGVVAGWARLANDPETLVAEVLKAGVAPEVSIEATYGWYWAVDALQAAGANVHLVAPSKVAAFGGRRVKNDQKDCELLGNLLRANMLPEAWIAPPKVREWRE
jgi:transposase